jgi:hypothetical protein
MKYLLLFMFLLCGCSSIYSYGPKSKVKYDDYTYRSVYISDSELAFSEVGVKVIRNLEFCFKGDRGCERAFQTDNQYFKKVTFIDRGRETGKRKRKRVFVLNAFSKDTNGDGFVAYNDTSTLYAYGPRNGHLVSLQEEITFLDLESNVDTFTFLVMYEKNGVAFISQYDLDTLEHLRTIEK